ncbi:unnamed protein product [Brachionus calyciflorus]|uniref:Uncharacterized protein n=1 Tax=Brachionus calyciflorus TaxID=104777 RepID=A0A813WHS9_9BILA|nr:unnamed protein product [Brachionus calyciflorus]
MTRLTANSTKITANYRIHYKRSPNFIVKSFIEKNSLSAIRDSFLFLEKTLPDFPNLPEKLANISAITSEQTRKSLGRVDAKVSSEEFDTSREIRSKNSTKRNMKKRHVHSNTEDPTPSNHHHHHNHHSSHHTQSHQTNSTVKLERSISHQAQLVPIQKFSFFKWEINVDTLVRLFIVAMFCLMLINGLLYYKLRRIESLADSLKNDPSIISRLSNPRQFDGALLSAGQQDTNNWQSVITNTLDAISKMENSLKQLEKNFKTRDNSDDL